MGADASFLSSLLRAILPASLFPGNRMAHTIKRLGGVVWSGPFRGMKGVHEAQGGAGFLYPMLLGTFERELHPVIETALQIPFERVVNVGAWEGYYAIGLALRLPEAQIVAFEADSEGQRFLREMATRNNVAGRVKVLGWCGPKELEGSLSGAEKCLVVCDVEGYEDVLMDPAAVPSLRRSWLLIEEHERAAAGIGEALERRFSPSHRIVRVWQQPRTVRDYPLNRVLKWLPTQSWRPFLNEQRRYQMSWLWLEPLHQKG
jgi:hypothetical protein